MKTGRSISKGAKRAAQHGYCVEFGSWCDLTASLLNSCCLVMAAEVVKYFLPKLVDLHNYTPANSTQQKLSNWNVLNRQDGLLSPSDSMQLKGSDEKWEVVETLSLSRINQPCSLMSRLLHSQLTNKASQSAGAGS